MMKTHKIKILRDTPFDLAGKVIPITEFRQKYGYFCSSFVSDEHLVEHLSCTSTDLNSYWFEAIEVPVERFKIGDWVWHEKMKRAFEVVEYKTNDPRRGMLPNQATFDAVNRYTETYKRKASAKEIDENTLWSFCENKLLIGLSGCYYFDVTWKQVLGIQHNIKQYLIIYNCFSSIKLNISDEQIATYSCIPQGVKVGCVVISNEEIFQIAKLLKMSS